nr:alpha-L-rhamnosidase N-terminal domain-containing protein [Bacteroidales bacterium]
MKAKSIISIAAAFAATALLAVSCSQSRKLPCTLTDPLDPSAWDSSEWISAVDAPVLTEKVVNGDETNCRSADGASWFVSSVVNDKKVSSARWMTTGLGVYELYINGVPIGEEVLKPGFTHYQKTKISFTYDVTKALVTKAGGKNELAVQVTPGWWADKILTPGGHEGMVGKKCAFRGVLELVYSDGSVKLYGTDCDNWKAGIAGPVKHAAIFDGEEYDARELSGFATPEKLSKPEVNTEFSGNIFPTDGAEIYLRRDLAMSPVKAYSWNGVEGESEEEFGKVVVVKEFSKGETMKVNPGETLVVDFGQNASAVPSFLFKAAAGTVLTCLPSEILNDGNGARSRGMDGPEGS